MQNCGWVGYHILMFMIMFSYYKSLSGEYCLIFQWLEAGGGVKEFGRPPNYCENLLSSGDSSINLTSLFSLISHSAHFHIY